MANAYPGAYPAQGNNPGDQQKEAVPDSYFTESRKGEVNELRTLLRNFGIERDPKRKRDIIKKVIAYMTLGIDVSRLFSEMMMAIETRDLVIKKMVYLYLCNYAKTHPELAQMCTNTLQKDCGNEDPMVRGLALRALCGLNLPEMVEYISEPLRRSLTDGHAYVRKTGVMGILKLYHIDQDAFERCNFVDILYDMLKDPDGSVVTNCIIVLNEVMAKTPNGGMAINRAIMLHLLNRIREFPEFAVVEVLNLVPRYIAANAEEASQIMNLLDPVLGRSSAGAVMATIRAFLSLSEQLGDDEESIKRQIVDRVKAPLVTLVSAAPPELGYTLIKHVEALADTCPGIFDDDYRQFYMRYNDPTHVKNLKVSILPKLANPDNAPDIVVELSECVNNPNVKMSRLAIRSMTRIASRDVGGAGCAESIARRLVDMLDMDVDHVCSEAATALTHIIRKHPSLKTVVAPSLCRTLKYMKESSGKVSIIYLLGECGDIVKEAPYALEKLIDTYDNINETTVKIALLSSTMKLFFIRPPEVQKMLGRLLAKATDDVSSQDLHDRALLYYRMLKSGTDSNVIENAIKTDTNIADGINFAEEDDLELRKELMKEFNTLSTLYGKPSTSFIAEQFQVKYRKMPAEHPLDSSPGGVVPAAPAYTGVYDAAPTPVVQAPTAAAEMDFLDMGGSSASAAPSMPVVPDPSAISLDPSMALTGEDYQAKWEAIADGHAIVTTLMLKAVPTSTNEIESALGRQNIKTMASGSLDTEYKLYLFARDLNTNAILLIQSNINKTVGETLMINTIKVHGGDAGDSDQQKANKLSELIGSSLGVM